MIGKSIGHAEVVCPQFGCTHTLVLPVTVERVFTKGGWEIVAKTDHDPLYLHMAEHGTFLTEVTD